MKPDSEGFLYPEADGSKCIDCGLCEKVCHELNPYEERSPLKVFAANNKDDKVRVASSSGGVFAILAEKTINEGGVVFGARYDENWQVKLDYTETEEGIVGFRGSKYVQASTDTAYADCERFLKEGRKVLFTGSPCQIAGLKHFLRKDDDHLVTMDFVCHGTPSPKAWGKYLDETIDQINKSIQERNQSRPAFEFGVDADSMVISVPNSENAYMRAFLCNLDLRPSCHHCKAKCGRSGSDLTIGDFWGVQEHHPEMDDDKGTSLVLVNTRKGEEAMDMNQVVFVESTYQIASEHNPSIDKSVAPHPNRAVFFSKLDSGTRLHKSVEDALKPPFIKQVRHFLSSLKAKVYHLGKRGKNVGQGGMVPENTISRESISDIRFRSKKNGWKQYQTQIVVKK